jgi:uncharacterized protein (TIGR02466 family)
MNIIPIFPILISKSTIDVEWNKEEISKRLDDYFFEQNKNNTINRTLHTEPLFAPIVDYMNRTVAEYWKALDYTETFPVELNQLWANQYVKGNEYPHNLDVDGPANVTVVFYTGKESSEQGNLFFGNPIELILQTQPLTEERRHRDRYIELDGRTGDLVCFPSWLQHGIRPNMTDIPRYSIAGNYELKGLKAFKKFMSKK